MALLAARNEPDGLTLGAPGLAPIQIAPPPLHATPRLVTIWRDTVAAVPAGPAADAWLSTALGLPCGLVHQADPRSRPVAPAYAAPGDVVSFADGFPLLLTTTSSLADLNARLPAPVEMLRFRPNLVIDGATPWPKTIGAASASATPRSAYPSHAIAAS
ncbi:MAG: MOSC domain-containing protein [Rhodospirillales bacterium]